jgi:hypothetical protein
MNISALERANEIEISLKLKQLVSNRVDFAQALRFSDKISVYRFSCYELPEVLPGHH